MAHTNKVVRSINREGETLCVDVFVRPDGSFEFEEFRRDPEDGRGWFIIGHYGAARFSTADAALDRAKQLVGWLEAALLSRPG